MRLRIWTSLGVSLALLGFGAAAQESVRQTMDYPAPRFPRYVVQPNPKDLLEAARFAVRQTSGNSPLGKIEKGQDVYVITEWGQDPQVWDAIAKAWAERGVTAHAIGYWEVMGIGKEEYFRLAEKNVHRGADGGWMELGNFRIAYRQYFPESIRKSFGERPLTAEYLRDNHLGAYLDKHPEIQRLFAGTGNAGAWERGVGPKHAEKIVGNWVAYRPNDLLAKHAQYPSDVWNLVEEKILRPIPFVSEVTFVDPEGTNLAFSVTPAQSKIWSKSAGSSNHIYIYPSTFESTVRAGGMLGAHANHMGIFPTMRLYLNKDGVVERIEGGGKTGELFRILVTHPKLNTQNVKFPKAPAPGYWFLRQDGFATNPKYVRSVPSLIEGSAYTNSIDRNRAGVQHLSFSYASDDPADIAYAKVNGIPLEGGQHTAHMHVYFPTIRWKLRDTGEWITISDKGFVQAFNDPEIRALASQYGDPNLIFRYEWIPALPGINVPGDYNKDFAPDPWAYILKEWAGIKEGKYPYFVENYAMADTPPLPR
jgi:hypothetical protein